MAFNMLCQMCLLNLDKPSLHVVNMCSISYYCRFENDNFTLKGQNEPDSVYSIIYIYYAFISIKATALIMNWLNDSIYYWHIRCRSLKYRDIYLTSISVVVFVSAMSCFFQLQENKSGLLHVYCMKGKLRTVDYSIIFIGVVMASTCISRNITPWLQL